MRSIAKKKSIWWGSTAMRKREISKGSCGRGWNDLNKDAELFSVKVIYCLLTYNLPKPAAAFDGSWI